jgi:hypothetical protein
MRQWDASNRFTAVDLSRMAPDDLYRRPQPLSQWPTADIRIEDVRDEICIASWRRDVASADAISRRMSECAWDAKQLGFSYLLCDVISLPQEAPDLIEKLIEFNGLYRSLHAVLSHNVDPDLTRTWIKAEARNILMSPTALSYVFQRWQLDALGLKPSLTIRQICRRRLGLRIKTERLHLCDTNRVHSLTCKDLGLMDETHLAKPYVTLSLDRRGQTFASDVLLVYEASMPLPRPALISKLRSLESNTAAIPSLVLIWAMVEGLSVSVRGCDWLAADVVRHTHDILQHACHELHEKVRLSVGEHGRRFTVSGAIEGTLRLELRSPPATHVEEGLKDIWAFCRDAPAVADDASILDEFLEKCGDWVQSARQNGTVSEPPPLAADLSKYTLSFDDALHHHTDGML